MNARVLPRTMMPDPSNQSHKTRKLYHGQDSQIHKQKVNQIRPQRWSRHIFHIVLYRKSHGMCPSQQKLNGGTGLGQSGPRRPCFPRPRCGSLCQKPPLIGLDACLHVGKWPLSSWVISSIEPLPKPETKFPLLDLSDLMRTKIFNMI